MFHYIPWLSPLKVLAKGANDYILPLMVFIQLFTTFCKVNPRMRSCGCAEALRFICGAFR